VTSAADTVTVRVGAHRLTARLETSRAPLTCAAFRERLPFTGTLVQARWSGEACWIPLGDLDLGVPLEHPVSEPARGMVLFHPADESETEILVPYGTTRFASVHGPLQGTPFLTILDLPALARLGQEILMGGAQEIVFELDGVAP
jgi:hypothetical protein